MNKLFKTCKIQFKLNNLNPKRLEVFLFIFFYVPLFLNILALCALPRVPKDTPSSERCVSYSYREDR